MQDLSHALQCPPRSLEHLQSLILGGKFGGQAGLLKPLDKLHVADLHQELQARGIDTSTMRKPEMQDTLVKLLKGAQRVPSLLVLNPKQQLQQLNLEEYEILDCEPLHDLKGHGHNILDELPHIVPTQHKQAMITLIQSTLKDGPSGARIRVALIKVYLKLLKLLDVSDKIKQLLCTLVNISQILYLSDSSRTPKTVLRLYNITWLHHELCSELIPKPKTQARDRLYGAYFHDLVVHAPPQYQIVCLRSTNTESTEREFSQIKHIGLKATNRRPENVLTTVLLSMQAKDLTGTNSTTTSLKRQATMVTEVANKVPPYSGTVISTEFLKTRMASWQAHLQRISPYLIHGEGVWWKREQQSYRFLDSDTDNETQPQGPPLQHFRDTNIGTIWKQCEKAWEDTLESNTNLPTPYVRTFEHGEYTGRKSFPATSQQPLTTNAAEHTETQSELQQSTASLQELPDNQGDITCTSHPHFQTTSSISDTVNFPTVDYEQSEHTPHSFSNERQHNDSLQELSPNPTNEATQHPTTTTPNSRKISPPVVCLLPTLSNQTTEEPLDSVQQAMISCELDELTSLRDDETQCAPNITHVSVTDNRPTTPPTLGFNSKAAKQISTLLSGDGEEKQLRAFDSMRQKLKTKLENNQGVSEDEKKEYSVILAKLHTLIVSNKHKLKADISNFEKRHYLEHGSIPTKETPTLEHLLKKLNNIRKLLTVWHKFEI